MEGTQKSTDGGSAKVGFEGGRVVNKYPRPTLITTTHAHALITLFKKFSEKMRWPKIAIVFLQNIPGTRWKKINQEFFSFKKRLKLSIAFTLPSRINKQQIKHKCFFFLLDIYLRLRNFLMLQLFFPALMRSIYFKYLKWVNRWDFIDTWNQKSLFSFFRAHYLSPSLEYPLPPPVTLLIVF